MYYLQPEKVQVGAPSIVYNKQGTQITEPWQIIKFQPYSTTFWKEAALPTKTNANLGVYGKKFLLPISFLVRCNNVNGEI